MNLLLLTNKHYLIILVVFAFVQFHVFYVYNREGHIQPKCNDVTKRNNVTTSAIVVSQLLSAEDESITLKICDTIPETIAEPQDAAQPKVYDVDSNKEYPTTLVTAYFPMKSKHSMKQYESWIKNFLPKVSTPVVIYADKNIVSFLLEQRKGKPTVIFEYSSIWELPSVYQHAGNYLTKQNNLDREQNKHTPNLYAVWNSKPWMLSHVTHLNPFNSTYFFWIDMGCFRKNYSLENWPDIKKVNQVFNIGASNKMQVFVVGKYPFISGNNFTYEDASRKNIIMGTIFGGPAKGIRTWSKLFYYLHDSLLNQGLFVGKDESLMNYLGVLLQNILIITCKCGLGSSCEGRWFYFFHWYATEKEMGPNCFDSSSYFDMVDYIRRIKS